MVNEYDFAVVGAGIFGIKIAIVLGDNGQRVAIFDRGDKICGRATYANQARIHNGYHYPRSFSTALGSHKNYDRFCREMEGCVHDQFEHVYAIGQQGSYTNAYQFQEFCRILGLPIRSPRGGIRKLFDRHRIQDAFVVRESAFDAVAMRSKLEAEIAAHPNVTLYTDTECSRIELTGRRACLHTSSGPVIASGVFIATYAETNTLLAASGLDPLDLKAEIAEICLVDLPPALRSIGVTVMDGPYFSTIPMPAAGCHSLTHVRYTPHVSWSMKDVGVSPYQLVERYRKETRFLSMIKDAQRYMPALESTHYRGSLFEVKAIPNKHEIDDGRPIIFHQHCKDPSCISVLGSKVDSVFELEDAVREFLLRGAATV